MKLSEFAAPLAAKKSFIKASFAGFAGSGKTRTASEFVIGSYKSLGCTKPILIIDNERGSRFLVNMFGKAGIQCELKETFELADVLTAFDFLRSGEIDYLFIDGLTKVWYKFIRDYKAANGSRWTQGTNDEVIKKEGLVKVNGSWKKPKPFMSLQDWGKVMPPWQEKFSDVYVDIESNCVFTGRGGFQYDMEEDERGKKQFVKSGVKVKLSGETPFESDLNVWMEQDQIVDDGGKIIRINREAVIFKDRSTLIDGKRFTNPTYSDFAPVIDYLKQTKKGVVKGKSDETNLAPSESYSTKKDDKKIVLEEIKGVFDLMGFGTDNHSKQIKPMITDLVFGSTSPVAVSKMEYDYLVRGSTILKNLQIKLGNWKNMDAEKVTGIVKVSIKEYEEMFPALNL